MCPGFLRSSCSFFNLGVLQIRPSVKHLLYAVLNARFRCFRSMGKKRRRVLGLRVSESLERQIQEATRRHGHKSISEFIRTAVETNLKGEAVVDRQAEDRIAASFDRMSRELRKLGNAQQALFAFTDALARVILHCVPEPVASSHEQALARAKDRHARLLKMTALSMQGDARAALLELVDRVE